MHAIRIIDSPIGALTLTASQAGITRIDFDTEPNSAAETTGSPQAEAHIANAISQLEEYFGGSRTEFDVPLDIESGTEFQRDVWAELTAIPYGKTATYAEVAARIGRPKACRAVGGANNKNPIPLLVPCHRVIGASGTLVGFAGGLDKKAALLKLEKDRLASL